MQASTKAKSLWKTSKRALAEAGHSVPQPLDESPFLPVPNVFSSWMVKHGALHPLRSFLRSR